MNRTSNCTATILFHSIAKRSNFLRSISYSSPKTNEQSDGLQQSGLDIFDKIESLQQEEMQTVAKKREKMNRVFKERSHMQDIYQRIRSPKEFENERLADAESEKKNTLL
jgi:hypothetical protein